MSWNPQQGLRPLLRWYGDTTHGAGNFGTDGVDMVWTYGQGPEACKNDSDNPEVWTAPYTLDPDEVAATAHRLRSDYRGMSGSYHYEVGFGYAGRGVGGLPAPYNDALFIVRLSDGVSWTIPGAPDDNDLSWSGALGFTEEEIFVKAFSPGGMNILRIRL
ncbi:MAG: hypothetical protein GY851_24855, partial [bacterium]|nr:hypothetical protein [bacterium]